MPSGSLDLEGDAAAGVEALAASLCAVVVDAEGVKVGHAGHDQASGPAVSSNTRPRYASSRSRSAIRSPNGGVSPTVN